MRHKREAAFTLIELMLAISILGILAALVIPRFGEVYRKAREAMTKGNLGTIRSAIAIYYGDTEGQLPTDDLTSLTGKYIRRIPLKSTPPYHPDGNSVTGGDVSAMSLSRGDWFYVNTGPLWGTVMVNCIHSDLRGAIWTSY